MTTFRFVFIASKKILNLGKISLRITHKQQSRYINLNIQLESKDWDSKKEISNQEAINHKINESKQLLIKILAGLTHRTNYHVDDVVDLYQKHINCNSFVTFAKQLATSYEARGQTRTARAYLSAINKLLEFCSCDNLSISEISASLIENFERSMINEGLSRNTISFYMRNLRVLYNKAVSQFKLVMFEHSPFQNVFTGVERTRKRAINRQEITRMSQLNLRNEPTLLYAQKLFFFAFYTRGMSFVDMAYLRKSNLKDGIITYRRSKTGSLIEIKVTKELQQLINYFDEMNQNSVYLLPIIKDQTKSKRTQYESALRMYNKRLGIIGDRLNFSKSITSHVARHSWASMAKFINTPLSIISEALGHSNENTTRTYLASFEQEVLNKVSSKIYRLIGNNTVLTQNEETDK